MVGWHHQLNGHEFEQLWELVMDREGLVCCGSQGHKESDTTESLYFHFTPWKVSYDQSKQHIKKQRHYFANKGPSSQGYGFSSGHVWMCELNYKES